MVVGFPPGGGTDIAARLLAQKLGEAMGQQVVVDNRGGGGGVIGSEIVAKSAPDGHTLLMANVGHTVNPALFGKLPYDTVRDFVPITLVVMIPNILVAHPSLPVRDFKQLLVLARAKPGSIVYGSGGNGSSPHLAMELLKYTTRIDMLHVPYKGGGPSVVALMAGEVSLAFATMPSAMPYVKQGRLRALAVSSPQRSATARDVPTVAELGYPGFNASGLAGLVAPAGTQRELVLRLREEVVRALRLADVNERLLTLGFDPVGSTPDEFDKLIRTDIEKWIKLVREANIKVD